ncbi:metalloendoproteinase 1-MMP-like [Prosopis cineraria]|uniref:metalloendoproteinase 1-MMP-like n=1 Tax=Prosopis cineraria TaxID=364024 RepID=UPI00240FF7EA|nr:metalloendoproteinase 1-MMP-like [Prosopis cineraria]
MFLNSSYRCFFFFTFVSLLLSRPCFPVRTIPETATVITAEAHSHNATWHNFSRLLNAERGSQIIGVSELKKYFRQFGYLPRVGTTSDFTNTFDARFESALLLYQKRLGLPVTGKLDSHTISTITMPRCGVSDDSSHVTHSTRHFSYFNGKPRWVRASPMTLTYAFSPDNLIERLSISEIRTVFKRSFSRWASVIPVNFRETSRYESADIRIGFYHRNHGDGQPFDGVLGVLAHAFCPENGRFHLDAAETWSVDFERDKSKVAVDLESVVTHEIGHILGLAHSSVKGAVMYPSLKPRTKKVELKIDDVEGVQALYGSNPNFAFSTLLQSESSSNLAIESESAMSKWTVSLTLGLLIIFLST